MSEPIDPEVAREARLLLRATRSGTLATVADGQPHASLVTPAVAPDGSVLLLLSDLSEHTRHLRADPRCTLLVAGPAAGPNPQTAPRVAVSGAAALADDPALHARWVGLHPYAAFYADFSDFHLWRLLPERGQYVGGFARAFRLGRAELIPDAAAVIACESEVVSHCNADHADALDAIAAGSGADGSGWSMVGCDIDGFDLVREETVLRIAWSTAVTGLHDIRKQLIHLAGAARKRAVTTAGPSPVGSV